MDKITKISVGVDVSKDSLSVCFHQTGKVFEIRNSAKGIDNLIEELSEFSVDKIVLEASGGFEERVMIALEVAGYNCWRVDPRMIKGFVASEGCRAKTDEIDAKMIALFAYKKEQKNKQNFASEQSRKLQAFFRRKQEIKDMIVMEKLRLGKPTQKHFQKQVSKVINFLEQEVKILDEEISMQIEQNEKFAKQRKIIESVPGVGRESAIAVIAEMPELGKIKNKEAAALLGVAPYNKESGKYKGKAKIKDGREGPRKVLFMAALTACRFNPDFKIFYNRLIAAGKPPKVAIVGVMRKIVELINVLLKEERMWVAYN